MKLQSPYTW